MGRDLINNQNDIYKLFSNKFIYSLERAFPLKTYYKKEAKRSRWISKVIKVSYQRMRFLNNSKKNLTVTSDVLNYINRYHLIQELCLKPKKN